MHHHEQLISFWEKIFLEHFFQASNFQQTQGKSKEDKSELKEGKSQIPQKKGKKNEKIEDEDLPKAKKEKKTEEPPAASGRKRKENISAEKKTPPPKKGKKTETKRPKEIDADAAFVMSATDDEEMVEEMETDDPNETRKTRW